jgi:hypothetical protein
MDEPKRTYITPDEELQAMERPGFTPVCRYGSMVPEQNEIGAIGELAVGESTYEPQSGVFVNKFRCLERIFVKD